MVARNRRGYLLLTGAAFAVALLALTGMVFDAGYVQLQQQRIQTAADGAVVAAVAESGRTQGRGAMLAAARTGARRNGFTHGKDVRVEVHWPPVAGRYAGNARWIEATVAQSSPTFFLKALGWRSEVSARAVAKAGDPGDACLFALNAGREGALEFTGSGTVDSCGIVVNSSHAGAVQMTGRYTMLASSFQVTGGVRMRPAEGGQGGSAGNAEWGPNSYPVTGAAPIADPLWYVPAPAVAAGCHHVNRQLAGTARAGAKVTLQPGVYCGGLRVGNGWQVEFAPGVYVLRGGGLEAAEGAVLHGEGVMFYNTAGPGYPYGPVRLAGGARTSLQAPAAGRYEGVLFFQDRQIAGAYENVIDGQGLRLDGALYFKTQALALRGNTSWKYTIVVADTVRVTGATVLRADYSELANGNPLQSRSVVFGE